MKIEKVIMSSDSNPLYLDFWPIVSKIWKEKFNIQPILFYIDDDHDIEINNDYGEVIKYKPIPGIPVYLQCLWIRYWSYVLYPNEVCMISDIDMIPLSEEYFINQLKDINNEIYVHINPCYKTYGTLPSCYHICKGKLFKEILNLPLEWEDSIKDLFSRNLGVIPGNNQKNMSHWFADERYSSYCIFNYKHQNENNVLFINRNGGQNGRRIDRSDWTYDVELCKSGYYYDSHSIRPYSQYKNKIDDLIKLIL